MDPMKALDFEHRNGYSSKDIDSFVETTDAVALAMERIKAGTFTEDDFDQVCLTS